MAAGFESDKLGSGKAVGIRQYGRVGLLARIDAAISRIEWPSTG